MRPHHASLQLEPWRRYSYVLNSQYRYTDPSGHFVTDINDRPDRSSPLTSEQRLIYYQASEVAYQAVMNAYLNTHEATLLAMATQLVEGNGVRLGFVPAISSGGLGTAYATTSFYMNAPAGERAKGILVGLISLDRPGGHDASVQFLAHVLVHEAAHVVRGNDPRMSLAEAWGIAVNSGGEKSFWDRKVGASDFPWEGYYYEKRVFGTLEVIH